MRHLGAVSVVLLALIGLTTWGFMVRLVLAPLRLAEPHDGCAIPRIQPDECRFLMEDR